MPVRSPFRTALARRHALGLASAAALLGATSAAAIEIRLDYTYDTQDFFGSGNPDGASGGALARAALEDAAQFFSDLLDDEFVAIETPEPFVNGPASWQWSWEKRFTHPGTGSIVSIDNPSIAANEYVVYAGGRSIGGTTLGRGGPGGFGSSFGGSFFPSDKPAIDAITEDFESAIQNRGQADGDFGAWGGTITFDNDGSTTWNFDWTNPPVSGASDFYSVAIHELGHALGFGNTDWESLVSGGVFTGPASRAENGGTNPGVSSDDSHWADGTQSVVRGTSILQEASMDPTLTRGDRKLWTDLDSAGLADIGWEIALAVVGPLPLAGDFNANGAVEQGDLDLVLGNWGAATTPDTFLANTEGLSTGVDQEELDAVFGNWGASLVAPGSASIPEPAGVTALLGLGALATVLRRNQSRA